MLSCITILFDIIVLVNTNTHVMKSKLMFFTNQFHQIKLKVNIKNKLSNNSF